MEKFKNGLKTQKGLRCDDENKVYSHSCKKYPKTFKSWARLGDVNLAKLLKMLASDMLVGEMIVDEMLVSEI